MLDDTKSAKEKNNPDVTEMIRAQKPDDFTDNLWYKLFLFTKNHRQHCVQFWIHATSIQQ